MASIIVHHLNHSRSQRVLWLLEELGCDYEIRHYARDPKTRLAPPELEAVHPLGKSPVLEDDGLVIIESGAIVEHLIEKYGQGRFVPPHNTPEFSKNRQLIHFAEGSAMLPLLLGLYTSMLGDAAKPLQPRIDGERARFLNFLENELGDKPFFLGNQLNGCDIMLSFVIEASGLAGHLENRPNLAGLLARFQSSPAYQRALEKGGPYRFA
jgi:glutathione S-transferase